jgi:hypothetical protein
MNDYGEMLKSSSVHKYTLCCHKKNEQLGVGRHLSENRFLQQELNSENFGLEFWA